MSSEAYMVLQSSGPICILTGNELSQPDWWLGLNTLMVAAASSPGPYSSFPSNPAHSGAVSFLHCVSLWRSFLGLVVFASGFVNPLQTVS